MNDYQKTISRLRDKVVLGEYEWSVARNLGCFYISLKINIPGDSFYLCAIDLTDNQFFYFQRLTNEKRHNYIVRRVKDMYY